MDADAPSKGTRVAVDFSRLVLAGIQNGYEADKIEAAIQWDQNVGLPDRESSVPNPPD